MTNPKSEQPSERADYVPDWVQGHQGAVHEGNWAEFEAKGFRPLSPVFDYPGGLESAQSIYGTEHVYTGDRYDRAAGRPLRHKPGTSIYIDPEGEAIGHEKLHEWQQKHQPETDPGSS